MCHPKHRLGASLILIRTGPFSLQAPLNKICRALQATKAVHAQGFLDKNALMSALSALEETDCLFLHVVAQNAGIIVRRSGSQVFFDTFEASAQSAKVLAATTALVWDFPGSSVSIPDEVFQKSNFLQSLTAFLHQASHETVHDFVPTVSKAGSAITEYRDTPSPSLISSLLVNILKNNGSTHTPRVITKRIHDDVIFGSKGNPWRRSPLWLVLRVSLRLCLQVYLGEEKSSVVYKGILCIVLYHICDELRSNTGMHPEALIFCRMKLARRLSKLECLRSKTSPEVNDLADTLMLFLEGSCRASIQSITNKVNVQWEAFKAGTTRRVGFLPKRAPPDSLQLTLQNSRNYLDDVCAHSKVHTQGPQDSQVTCATEVISPCGPDRQKYLDLMCFEDEIKKGLTNGHVHQPEDSKCLRFGRLISEYFARASNAYSAYPEGNSIMLLTLMELWVALDQNVVHKFPLLKDYKVPFSENMLCILQILQREDMIRLNVVEGYLRRRNSLCQVSFPSLFDDPSDNCFAVRFFDQNTEMQNIRRDILSQAELDIKTKEAELQSLTEKYNALSSQQDELRCKTRESDLYPGLQEHDDQGCTKCYLRRKMRRMRIKVFEYPLPDDVPQQKAICFELVCPQDLIVYRDITWKLMYDLSRLVNEKFMPGQPPQIKVFESSRLAMHGHGLRGSLTLASARKAFHGSHYATKPLPVKFSDIRLPCGFNMTLFDTQTLTWCAQHNRLPSLATLCMANIPYESPLQVLQWSPAFATDKNGPTPNEIVSSLTKCPQESNLSEFFAYQDLHTEHFLQWPRLLRELSSSNLNFSAATTTIVITRVALVVGPRKKMELLRIKHWVFRDKEFCAKLLRIVLERVNKVANNWRESQCILSMLIITLRVWNLASDDDIRKESVHVCSQIRRITRSWIQRLQKETHSTQKGEGYLSQRRRDAVWACLLTRRTLEPEAMSQDSVLDAEPTEAYVEASIVLQQNLSGKLSTIPQGMRNALIQDWRLLQGLEHKLRLAISRNPTILSRAILKVWQMQEGSPVHGFESWSSSDYGYSSKFQNAKDEEFQTVDYNPIDGMLLVNKKPLGQLPDEFRQDVAKSLFGDRPLLAYPMKTYGMSYRLAMPVEDHIIYFGTRDEKRVVRAFHHFYGWFEFVPRNVFGQGSDVDLPDPLIKDYVHWFDLERAQIHIRPEADTWKHERPSHWVLDLHIFRAFRRNSTLVDPRSALFQRVSNIFADFEPKENLLLYQPDVRNMSLQLPRLDLQFVVNQNGLLESRELQAVIDTNQDAGTLYGLRSKLVLLDCKNQRLRSVILPCGPFEMRCEGIHVAIRIIGNGSYGQYAIDHLLRRLETPSEPLLIYMRALYHALTSFVIPDSLTGRTGTEEALRYLRMANAMPWTPLTHGQRSTLHMIRNLSPIRVYYPEGLYEMQQVSWHQHTTTIIQNEALRPQVDQILRHSDLLQMFHDNETHNHLNFEQSSNNHLHVRSLSRTLSFAQRDMFSEDEFSSPPDTVYEPRDVPEVDDDGQKVAEIVYYLKHWSSEIDLTADLPDIIQGWVTIRGFVGTYEKNILNEIRDVSMEQEWASIINYCRTKTSEENFGLMFFFGTMSHSTDISMDIIRVFLAFATYPSLQKIKLPPFPEYKNFFYKEQPSLSWLKDELQASRIPSEHEEVYLNDARLNAREQKRLREELSVYNSESDRQILLLIDYLINTKWPDPSLVDPPPSLILDHIHIEKAYDVIRPDWQRLATNLHLTEFLKNVQDIFERIRRKTPLQLAVCLPRTNAKVAKVRELPSIQSNSSPSDCDSFDIAGNEIIVVSNKDFVHEATVSANTDLDSDISYQSEEKLRTCNELRSILTKFSSTTDRVRREYGQDLERSLDAFLGAPTLNRGKLGTINPIRLSIVIENVSRKISELYSSLEKQIKDSKGYQWLELGGLSPRITPTALLQKLRQSDSKIVWKGLKDALVKYAVSLTTLQRLIRLETHFRLGRPHSITAELENLGHTNWRPSDHVEWLLLEVESNIMIREEQVNVAIATINPGSHANSVLQMNMGEGKSSIILPISITSLSNERNLLRVIVPKALLPQMAQVLQTRIGGMLNRQIVHAPFSRRTPTTSFFLKAFQELHEGALQRTGVILSLPEHILSFKLSGLQRLSDARVDEGRTMLNLQRWLDTNCRDVLDESDFTLAVRTQLIYPSGSQKAVDGHPDRWKVIESLLHIVRGLLWNVQKIHPRAIEIYERSGEQFPTPHFLKREAEDALIQQLVNILCQGHSAIISIPKSVASILESVRKFVSSATISKRRLEELERYFRDRDREWNNILLLRGLLVHRILILCLKKRWNVTYGIHPRRDPISVPFHAKGVPSETAEWGHPDVAITLTCLSFYYAGLSVSQIRESFVHMLRSHDKGAEYERWVLGSESAPNSLRDCHALNLDDEFQVAELWFHFRYNTVVIDYYLNNFVFPLHAKQFEYKLQASGWDIPLPNESITHTAMMDQKHLPASKQTHIKNITNSRRLTTGFSGTNDNRAMLPLTIKQNDLPQLLKTNAEVLTYLLQNRNRGYEVMKDLSGNRLTEIGLLGRLAKSQIRVFIDAGAQILELDNLSLVKAWLQVDHESPAAVFFNEHDKPFMYHRKGQQTPLLGSPYADSLAECLVYLDESHTRGTDLQLPPITRGALTLGPGQTKDSLIQGTHSAQAILKITDIELSGDETSTAGVHAGCHVLCSN